MQTTPPVTSARSHARAPPPPPPPRRAPAHRQAEDLRRQPRTPPRTPSRPPSRPPRRRQLRPAPRPRHRRQQHRDTAPRRHRRRPQPQLDPPPAPHPQAQGPARHQRRPGPPAVTPVPCPDGPSVARSRRLPGRNSTRDGVGSPAESVRGELSHLPAPRSARGHEQRAPATRWCPVWRQLISSAGQAHFDRAPTGIPLTRRDSGVEWRFASPWPPAGDLVPAPIHGRRPACRPQGPHQNARARSRSHLFSSDICLISGAAARVAEQDVPGAHVTMPGSGPLSVLVVGGRVAGLETLPALRHRACERIERTRLTPEPEVVYRPTADALVVTVGARSESTPSASRPRPTPSRARPGARAAHP